MPQDLKVLTSIYAKNDSLGKSIITSWPSQHQLTIRSTPKMISWKLSIAPDTLLIKPENCNQSRINRLPITKVEHFLDFLFSSNLMQDVAYGVNKINFDSGDEQKVANSILTMKYSSTTAYYRQFFSDTSFEPISESTLWKKTVRNKSITKKKPSWLRWYNCSWDEWILHTQHSTAESVKRMDLAKNMETGKPSLKAKFLNKCNASSTLPTHSTSFGLSDVSDLALQEPHCA